ncbi:asparagine synthase (glutamine-hydrolyzing) [Rhodocytophaga rosea]|uniref:asparagine synthase (glutamine-hydrolyzing) n=1 Tax=Rhodocytophaga rosea TaxID=2704465 RepID=A0A6C0GV71_9BACT|nr:asparagine synthase (glutamine-hydrolyzing) [Rhodocytophaga rosea]QHT71250.1 asparagine synthase (glutamine-hydrolyzing) [Rhodocytophaga rosea]
MCGIHLIIDKTFQLSQAPVQQMLQALHYRGPDAASQLSIKNHNHCVYIAQNRLRITDIRSEADTLFQSEDGRYTLAYNGEIYNYQDIRKRLERSYHFRTQSDTEVLLYLLIAEGLEGISQVNGMFAFTFYDRMEEKLYLCRDRFGMKPLFYAENEKYLIVSSEIKGILASGLIEKEPNSKQIPHYLRFKFAQRPNTFYKNIYEIEPGYVYIYNPGKSLLKSSKLPAFQVSVPENFSLTQIEQSLVEAVQMHLPAEVPAGLFLSGGVDSTLLLAMIRESGKKDFPVFSIANSAKDASFGTQDYLFARKAAQQYGAAYHEIEISPDLLANFYAFVEKIDQPVGDGAAWLTWLLSQEAKKFVKVIISGAGADELFAGYNRHQAYFQYLKHYSWLQYLLPVLKKSAFLLPDGSSHPFRKQARLLHKLLSQMDVSRQQTFVNFTAHLAFAETNSEDNLFPEATGQNMEQYLQQALQYDREHFLSADVLAITDRMTMQASLEARLPYLDAHLSALMESIPASVLLQKGKKWILKDILSRKGGQAYVQRSKEGFGMPFGQWLKSVNGKFLRELLQNRKALLYEHTSYAEINKLVQLHLAGKSDYSSELWTIVLLIAWLEQEFGKKM